MCGQRKDGLPNCLLVHDVMIVVIFDHVNNWMVICAVAMMLLLSLALLFDEKTERFDTSFLQKETRMLRIGIKFY